MINFNFNINTGHYYHLFKKQLPTLYNFQKMTSTKVAVVSKNSNIKYNQSIL